MKHEETYAVLTGEVFTMTLRLEIDTAIRCVKCLVQEGFQSVEQLRGVQGMAWQCKRPATRGALEAIGRYVTACADVRDKKNSVLKKIEMMLESGASREATTVRYDGGPRKAVKIAGVAGWSEEYKMQRIEDARLSVTIDSITGGRRSYVSAVRGYLCFMMDLFPGKVPVPPAIDDLVLWSQFFKHGGTFATYCSAVRWATEGCGCDTSAFDDPILKRAKTALKLMTRPKQKRWIGAKLTMKIMSMAMARRDGTMAMLYCAAYVFMARVPSELLTWQVDGERLTSKEAMVVNVAVQHTDVEMRVHLGTRKNSKFGDTIRRVCSCHLCKALCPIHVIGQWLTQFKRGDAPFGRLSPAAATRCLRNDLSACGVKDGPLYSLHSFRRGGAQDMKELGCPIEDIKRAGGWASRAYCGYLVPEDMDLDATISFMVDESDSE
jgi:hypothetical protein